MGVGKAQNKVISKLKMPEHTLSEDIRYGIVQEWLVGQGLNIEDLTVSAWFNFLDLFEDRQLTLTTVLDAVYERGGWVADENGEDIMFGSQDLVTGDEEQSDPTLPSYPPLPPSPVGEEDEDVSDEEDEDPPIIG